jgi:hypothetical protein
VSGFQTAPHAYPHEPRPSLTHLLEADTWARAPRGPTRHREKAATARQLCCMRAGRRAVAGPGGEGWRPHVAGDAAGSRTRTRTGFKSGDEG